MRWRAHGLWSGFTASDVGIFDDDFTGESWALGAELIANVYQKREFFIDVLGGARFLYSRVESPLVGEGQETFFLPYVSVRLERATEWMSTVGSVSLGWQVSGVTGVDSGELERLGRTSPDDDWAILRWAMTHSMYLEPLINRAAWEDPATPESSSLAHELVLSFKGQYAFDNRLIPNLERPIGGLHTVRGYPESVVAADTAVIGTVEYRFHLPRALAIQPEPQELFGEPFRIAPQYVYGRPDWDLVLKGFIDVGQAIVSNPLSFEQDETLVGAGIGIDLEYRRNFSLRLDWGFVLKELEARNVNSGSNRLHALLTVLF